MLRIPQGRRWRWFWTLATTLFCASGCFGGDAASSQTQRRIAEARLQDDLSVSLTYGSVRAFNSEQVILRSASPLVELTVETGPEAVGPVSVELRNQHREADLRVASVTFLDSEEFDGCPVVSRVEIDCITASESIGQTCETSGQCPEGLRCAAGMCASTNLFASCEAPDFTRIDGQETSLRFDITAEPCERTVFETVLTEDSQEVVFAVVGPSNDVELIANLDSELQARGADFLVLLGDNVASPNEDGLAELELALARAETPAVVVAGPREIAASTGTEFLRRFGPHDHVWKLKGVRFFAFYSAPSELGPRGLSRLDDFLRQLQPAEGEADGPLIGVTHVPPFDPNDLRDNALRNEFEAAQVMSLLEQRRVDLLFAGGLGTGYERIQGVEVFVTTARGTVANPIQEWLLVTVPEEGDVTVERFDL